MTVEEAKLIADIATPIAVLILGIVVHRTTSKLEARHALNQTLVEARLAASQALNQTLVEARLELFKKLAPVLNDLYCYFLQIGGWKELTPENAIERKRSADAMIFPLFSLFDKATYDAYTALFGELFKTYRGKGHNAQMRLEVADYNLSNIRTWNRDWDVLFDNVKEDAEQRRTRVHAAYVACMQAFSRELGAKEEGKWSPPVPSPRQS